MGKLETVTFFIILWQSMGHVHRGSLWFECNASNQYPVISIQGHFDTSRFDTHIRLTRYASKVDLIQKKYIEII